MVNINQIKNQPYRNINFKSKTNTKVVQNPSKAINELAKIGLSSVAVSTFLQDYKKTANDKNYFQLKIDKTTQKHYEPDVFQNAAGMNIFLGNDVLVTAPTGTGKTAIAEYAISRNKDLGKKTFYTTPLKALSNEKFLEFQKIYGKENVGLITGDNKINIDAPILVMTTEVYRNMASSNLFNFSSKEKNTFENLQTVIFDELQYLGDIDRGCVWEQSLMFTPKNVQILSLSATIENNKEINQWLATIKNREAINIEPDKTYFPKSDNFKKNVLINVPTKNRHVPLNYHIEFIEKELDLQKLNLGKHSSMRKIIKSQAQNMTCKKPENYIYKKITEKLNMENKLPAIYFVFSKNKCKNLLKYLSNDGSCLNTFDEAKEILNTVKRYKDEGLYLGETLDIEALKKGYAIHNSGLLPNQKKLIEELFQKKLLKVILATETLSAGINMPAKTTVITSPEKPSSTNGNQEKRILTPNEFHQMAGRAGRRGIDTEGHCYSLSCNIEQDKIYKKLIDTPFNKLESALKIDYSFIINYLNEFKTTEELEHILAKSFFAYDSENQRVDAFKLLDSMERFELKKEILELFDFIDYNQDITSKGLLLKELNGYEQVPIINLISDKDLLKFNDKQLASIIASYANLECNPRFEFTQQNNFEHYELLDAQKFAQKFIQDYNFNTEKLYPETEFCLNSLAAIHLYSWAELNQNCENSRQNWQEILQNTLGYNLQDEGTLFKEIVSTIDLTKQLIHICTKAEKIAQTADEQTYYAQLKNKLISTLDFIQKEPAIGIE